MSLSPLHLGLVLALLAGFACASEPVETFSKADVAWFETEIRPLLVKHCQTCHGEEKQSGELRLDHRSSILTGGDSGEAIVPGKPDESLLIEAVKWESYEMPPSGKLPDEAIAKLEEWVKRGAPWPKEAPLRTGPKEKITEADRAWWAFQPVRDPEPPAVDSPWPRGEIDQFLWRKLREAELTPAPEADRRTLIRRVTYGLTGLPPTPEEVNAFLRDESEDAYERLVDRLLDSPAYGEHQARWWLDLVRYAESDGYKQDAYRSNAWRYRDYVVRSFSADKPYDQFVIEQLAGDEVAPHDPDAVIATGFLNAGIYEYNQRDAMTQWAGMLDEVTDVTADVFLGLGFGCAKCHDHKYDPILQKDYFRLRAFFTPLTLPVAAPVGTPEQHRSYAERLAAWEAKTAQVRAEIEKIEAPHKKILAGTAIRKFPDDVEEMALLPEDERGPLAQQLAALVHRQVKEEYKKIPGRLKGETKAKYEALKKELAKYESERPQPLPAARVAVDVGREAPPTFIPGKERLGEIEPGFMTLFDPEPAEILPVDSALDSTGRRATLAEWLTDPEHPLTSRVLVNRLWMQHFGEGLTPNASDFGHLGEPPSHPELLDWLASRFVESGWSVKAMHRRIVTSSAYRQAALRPISESDPVAARAREVDPGNRLLWRMRIRRLTAEEIRDSMLALSGLLDRTQGGASVDSRVSRRSVYTKRMRNTKGPLLGAFDVPDGYSSSPKRNTTTTATQSLLMINGPHTLQLASAFAKRLKEEAGPDLRERVKLAYRLAYNREATSDEVAAAVAFITDAPSVPDSGRFVELALAGTPAARVSGDGPLAPLVAAQSNDLPGGDFTIDAVVLLGSLYPDATVRTIASQWTNSKSEAGWALGVTSTKSAYKPRNLIFQFVGEDATGKTVYEVVPSDTHLELNTPYRVTAAVRQADVSEAGVVFRVENLADPFDVRTARVTHQVVSRSIRKPLGPAVATTSKPKPEFIRTPTPAKFVIGGRDRNSRHRWDGLFGSVTLYDTALDADEVDTAPPVAEWTFAADNRLADGTGNGFDLESTTLPAAESAFVDFCHVLFNSNELLYLD